MAAAPVVDLSKKRAEQASPQPVPVESSSVPAPSPQAELYYQLQLLQEEVRSLRGLVEEQSHELQQLKQRQMDDYMDLDRRISGMSAGGSPPIASSTHKDSSSKPSDSRAALSSSAADDERRQYDAAYGLLKARKVDESIAAFKALVNQYPNGQYTANSLYWLGEIYLLNNQLDDARQSFSQVIERYPAHRKADDARFKLGKTYHLLGQQDKARALLEQVAGGNSSSARLAQAYLRDNL